MHEYETKWLLHDDWENVQELVIYGFGRVAKANIDFLMEEFNIRCIIDNLVKEGMNCDYLGISIVNRDMYRHQYERNGDKVVIMATGRALESIRRDLSLSGLIENKDFTDIKTFLGEWYLRYRNMLNIGRVAHSVTQKCTFRCRDCQLLMPYIDHPDHDPIKILKEDLDLLFSMADHVSDLDIMGGETFLYPKLLDYLNYLVVHYRSRIGNIQLVTNGSVIPDDEILSFIKKEGIHVRISDYTDVIPYGQRLNQFVGQLEHRGIVYFRFKDMTWSPFGYPYKTPVIGTNTQELKEHMSRCGGGMSHSLHGGNFYYCNTAGGLCENTGYKLPDTDYIDLKRIVSDPNGKIKLWAYCMGQMEKDGMALCRYCNGYDCEMGIPAGVQL